MKSSSLHDGRLWHLAVFSFILAALTGAALRFGLLLGFPWGWQFVNVRHAHSHLMFFGWVTPALMMLIIRWLPALTGRPFTAGDQRRQHRLLITIFCLALAAFATFLWFGYAPVPVLGVRLPLATLFAAGNMIAWYRFAFLYRRWTHGISRQGRRMRPLRLWDAALWFMGIATLGVWGVALFSLINVRDPLWMALSTHLFLDLFAEGWFVLAVLGFIYLFQPQAAEKWAQRGENWLVMGLPVARFPEIVDNLEKMAKPIAMLAKSRGGQA